MLKRICARLYVAAAEVAAFGDMPNDLAMLNWVGLPHVVANAHPLLLGLGFPIVPGNDDSGVGRTIQRWLQLDRSLRREAR
jgi:hydroxymethylpyrimidine pyrophosphatase-like HAD family hydrolase